MTAEKMIVRTAGERQLEALVSGPPDGLTVVLQNGTPAGLMAAPLIAAATAERGLRLVLYARPGYEGSTPDPGRQVAGAAADLGAVLDALGAAEFVTVGWSGGGPHALACAALLPGRCLAAATMAGPAPRLADGLDWWQGMGQENLAEFQAAEAGQQALTSFLEPAAREMASLTGADVVAGLGDLVSAADKAAVTAEFADYLAASFRAAVAGRSGHDGAVVARPVAGRAHSRRPGAPAARRGPPDPCPRLRRHPRRPHGPGRPPGVITAPYPAESLRAQAGAARRRARRSASANAAAATAAATPRLHGSPAPMPCCTISVSSATPRHTTAATAASAVPSASAVPAGSTVSVARSCHRCRSVR